MKRAYLTATVLIGGTMLFAASLPAAAQTNPSADALVHSLTPTGNLGTGRGIHVAAPTGTGATATAPNGHGPAATTTTSAATAPSASLSVLFATGSAELTPAAVKTLDILGKALTDPRIAGSKFRIEGHTDTVGTPDSNKALSDARAKAVAAYLATTFHVDPSKLEAVGLGQEGLLINTPPQTPEVRNRRVVVNLGS
jgi:OmpA-OmpF porin, OOP family